MKTSLILVVFLAVTAIAWAQNKDLECTEDCDAYVREFQIAVDDLKKTLNNPEKKAEFNPGILWVEMGIKLNCAKKACSGEREKIEKIRQNYGHIIGIIRSGQLKYP